MIILDVVEGGAGGSYGFPTYTVNESITVDGFDATRAEEVQACLAYGCNADPPLYYYIVYLGDAERHEFGPTMLARAPSERSVDFELTKAVFDRIMASLEFLP